MAELPRAGFLDHVFWWALIRNFCAKWLLHTCHQQMVLALEKLALFSVTHTNHFQLRFDIFRAAGLGPRFFFKDERSLKPTELTKGEFRLHWRKEFSLNLIICTSLCLMRWSWPNSLKWVKNIEEKKPPNKHLQNFSVPYPVERDFLTESIMSGENCGRKLYDTKG